MKNLSFITAKSQMDMYTIPEKCGLFYIESTEDHFEVKLKIIEIREGGIRYLAY